MTEREGDWVEALSERNLLGLLDVLLDLDDALQLDPAADSIAILPPVIRFGQLFPGDGINMRDHYGRLRWQIAKLLEGRGVLRGVEVVGTGHRWQQRITFRADSGAVKDALSLAQAVSGKRAASAAVLSPHISTSADAAVTVSTPPQEAIAKPPDLARLETALQHLSEPLLDGFLSHAEEDTDKATALYDALTARGVRLFFDKSAAEGLEYANVLVRRVNDAVRRSRGGIILATPTYMANYLEKNGYVRVECDTLTNLAAYQSGMPLIAVLWGLPYPLLLKAHPQLAAYLGVNVDTQGFDAAVDILARRFRPPAASDVAREVIMTGESTPGMTGLNVEALPSDALPEDVALALAKPCLRLDVSLDGALGDLERLTYRVWNTGAGDAHRVALFLPGVPGPVRAVNRLDAGRGEEETILMQRDPRPERPARDDVQAIIEFEDVGGNVYRQYADVIIEAISAGQPVTYHVGRISTPYLVAQRIVHV